jgi:hypothetical protein
MCRSTLFFIILFSYPVGLYSQSADSLKYKYTNQSVFRYGGTLLKGNERVSFKDLSHEFSMSDIGLDLYYKSKRCRTTSTILRYASMLSGFIYMGVAVNNGNKNTAYLFLGSQMAFLFTSRNYAIMASENLDRALWQRNKDLLFPASH